MRPRPGVPLHRHVPAQQPRRRQRHAARPTASTTSPGGPPAPGYRPIALRLRRSGRRPRVVTGPDDPRLSNYQGVPPGFDVELDLLDEQDEWWSWLRELGYDVPDGDAALRSEPDRPGGARRRRPSSPTGSPAWLGRAGRGPWFAHASYCGRIRLRRGRRLVDVPTSPTRRRRPIDAAPNDAPAPFGRAGHPYSRRPTDPAQLRCTPGPVLRHDLRRRRRSSAGSGTR